MTTLFGRTWALQIGRTVLDDLDMVFSVERSIRRNPNVAEIRVFNLKPETRAAVEQGGEAILSIGLGAAPSQIFRGDVRWVWSERTGPDYITVIQARDGGRAYSDARVSRAYGPGTPLATVIRDTAEAMGVGLGNLEQLSYRLRNGASALADGYVADGRASRVMNELIRGAGYRWSIQAGALQIMARSTPLQDRAEVLASDTGLLDTPAWDERGNRTRGRRGVLKARALYRPGLEPGRKVRVEAALVRGDFEIRKASIKGDTRGDDWTVDLEMRPIS